MANENIVSHDQNCLGLEQTPIPSIDLSKPIPDDVIERVQKGTIRTFRPDSKLPIDANTIPSYSNPRYRHLSRSEALERIHSDPLALCDDVMDSRDEWMDEIIKKVMKYDGPYYTSSGSCLADFPIPDMELETAWESADACPHKDDEDCNCWQKRKKHEYVAIAKSVKEVYSIKICSGCLYEACYIWRQADLVKRYIDHQRAGQNV